MAIFANLGLASLSHALSPCSTSEPCLLLALQRKDGLFKKAYELGVLCSVDIAVIVFGACAAAGHRRALSECYF